MFHYECDRCGACCRGHLIVEADELDLLREPRLAAADPHFHGLCPAEVLRQLEEEGKCLVIAAARPCRFLADSGECSIHPTRPVSCVAMPPGDEQCQLARASAGLPRLEPIDEGDGASVTKADLDFDSLSPSGAQ